MDKSKVSTGATAPLFHVVGGRRARRRRVARRGAADAGRGDAAAAAAIGPGRQRPAPRRGTRDVRRPRRRRLVPVRADEAAAGVGPVGGHHARLRGVRGVRLDVGADPTHRLAGNVVISTRWQTAIATPCPGPINIEPCMASEVNGIKGALAYLRAHKRRVQPDVHRTSYFGFSFGGIITANLANRYRQLGVPKPRAIFLDDPHDGGLTGATSPRSMPTSAASPRRRSSSATRERTASSTTPTPGPAISPRSASRRRTRAATPCSPGSRASPPSEGASCSPPRTTTDGRR